MIKILDFLFSGFKWYRQNRRGTWKNIVIVYKVERNGRVYIPREVYHWVNNDVDDNVQYWIKEVESYGVENHTKDKSIPSIKHTYIN